MQSALEQGERVRFRCHGDDQAQSGTVRKPLHILAATRRRCRCTVCSRTMAMR